MNKRKQILAGIMAVLMTAAAAAPVMAAEQKYCVALGADLKSEERETVLKLLNVTEDEVAESSVTVTNTEEHEYLDDYLSQSVIGSRALSSVFVREASEGYGIQVTTHNISYCTTGMYQNALATAGMKDATVVVAGPFSLSGTAALSGAVKAYSEISGEPLKAEAVEAATEELVTTGEVAEGITDEEDINKAIDEAAGKLNINLSEEDRQKINDLMQKIGGLDLDVNQLKSQAKQLYDKLDDLNIDVSKEEVQGFLAKIIAWIKQLFA